MGTTASGLSIASWESLASRRAELVRVLSKWRDSLKRIAVELEDVVQDALAKAWAFRKNFDASRGTPWGWLCMIAHRAASKMIKTAETARQKAMVRCAWHGPVPFGFRNVDGVLVADLGEQRVLSDARAMLKDGISLRGVARAMNTFGYRTRNGRDWTHTTLSAALSRST